MESELRYLKPGQLRRWKRQIASLKRLDATVRDLLSKMPA